MDFAQESWFYNCWQWEERGPDQPAVLGQAYAEISRVKQQLDKERAANR